MVYGWRTTRQCGDDLDESIRPRELMHFQLYAPLYQRIASEMSGAGLQRTSKDATLHNVDNEDNDKPNTFCGVVQEGAKAVCSGGLSGGTRRSSNTVTSITTIIAPEVSQLTDSSHGEEVNGSPECTPQDHDDDRPRSGRRRDRYKLLLPSSHRQPSVPVRARMGWRRSAGCRQSGSRNFE